MDSLSVLAGAGIMLCALVWFLAQRLHHLENEVERLRRRLNDVNNAVGRIMSR